MSHYVTAVFHRPCQEIDELLAPYNEQDEEYMEFIPCQETEEELKKKYQEVKQEHGYKSMESFMRDYYGYEQNASGQWGYTSNPAAKWDWYQEGGTSDGFFRTKEGKETNEDFVRNIDLSPDPVTYNQALRFWEIAVEGSPRRDEEKDLIIFYTPEYYLQQFGTKEKFALSSSVCIPWAFVTADGEWWEKGAMGWFGASDATQESRDTFAVDFMDYMQQHPDLVVTAVDCHI